MKRVRIGCLAFWILSVYGCCDPTAKQPDDKSVPSNLPTSTNVGVGIIATVHATRDTVIIKMMKFIPDTIEVREGDTLVFVNKDMVAHDVTEKDRAWNSPKIEIGESWEMIAKESVNYFCSIHVVMTGRISVKE